MQRQGGNFLLQALLALALVIAFIPFFTQKLAMRDKDSRMYAVSTQIETAQTASKIYLRENLESIPYNTVTISGNDFSDTLEPYGLPLGFLPRTAFGQKISLIIEKTPDTISAYLEVSGGKLSGLERSELVRRLGFYASQNNGNVYMIIPLDETFSDIVKRSEKDIDKNGFLSELNMGGFEIENINSIIARNSEFESLQTNNLSLFGLENGRKVRSIIDNFTTNKVLFQGDSDQAGLSITRGTLSLDNLSTKTISRFGESGNFTSNSASVYDFSMTAGRTNFTGPTNWNVKGNMITDNINLNIERLELSSFINASRGQDVFINPDSLEYSSESGIEAVDIYAENITLRDQTSTALANNQTGAVILDIRPAGTSVMPDILVDDINNDNFKILSKPDDDDSNTVTCKSIINGLNGVYNSKSLSQNIICQYVYWQRLEKRIDVKKCILDGKSNCD